MSPQEQLLKLTDWSPPQPLGAWHVMDKCFKGGVAGVAYVGTICQSSRNTGVNWDTGSQWKVFAHQLGHNFGAHHSFEKGQGKTGGVMDYGDGTLNSEYQFNTKFRKKEICATINRVVNTCPSFEAMLPECGNGRVEDGEACECSGGKKQCTFCTECQLQKGKQCTPDSAEQGGSDCCTKSGMLRGKGTICDLNDSDKGFCLKGKCHVTGCSRNPMFGDFCGFHAKNQCKIKCKMGSACDDLSDWKDIDGHMNHVDDGVPCKDEDGITGACYAGECVDTTNENSGITTTIDVETTDATDDDTHERSSTTSNPSNVVTAGFDDCQTYPGRYWEGYAQVHGGSTAEGGFTLSQCNQACMDISTCGAFTYAKNIGYCELWGTDRDSSSLAWGPPYDTYICNRGIPIEISTKCRDHYDDQAFSKDGKDYKGSLGYFTQTTQKQCNDRCMGDKACRSFTTTPDGSCTLNGHDTQEKDMVAAPQGVVTFFCNVGIYDPSTETTKPAKPVTPPPKYDPCKCSKDGTVEGIFTARTGCARHSGPKVPHYCMVSPQCETATPSRAHPGVKWRECNPKDEMPPPKCPNERYRGDGICDDILNTKECHYDDGDCCGANVIRQFCKDCKCRDPRWAGDQCFSMLKDVRKDLGRTWLRFGECVPSDDKEVHESWCCSEDGKRVCGEDVGTPEQPRICRSRFVANQQRTCHRQVPEPRSCSSPVNRLVFTPENWNVPQTVYVDARDDTEYEVKGHDFEVRLCHVARGADANCSAFDDAVVIQGVIRENEADSTTELENRIDNILAEVRELSSSSD